MIIAIPLANKVLSAHFGHCEEFAFVEVDDATKKVVKERRENPPAHEPGVLPGWLVSNKTTVAIVGGMGVRAQQMLEQAGVRVVLGAPSLPPAELVKEFLAGRLTGGDNTCDHGPDHVCDGHGADHGHQHHPSGKR